MLTDYRTNPAFSASDLKAYREGPPAMVPWRRAHPTESSPAMLVGSAAHAYILEGPDAFFARYAIKPEGLSLATKGGKEWRESIGDREILSADQGLTVRSVVEAATRHDLVGAVLAECDNREAPIFWRDERSRLDCRGLVDMYGGDVLADLKITRHAGTRTIEREAISAGWWHQLAFYRAGLAANGVEVRHVRIVAINPSEPELRMSLIELDPNGLDLIALENESTLLGIAECVANDFWPGAPVEWRRTELPAWYTLSTANENEITTVEVEDL